MKCGEEVSVRTPARARNGPRSGDQSEWSIDELKDECTLHWHAVHINQRQLTQTKTTISQMIWCISNRKTIALTSKVLKFKPHMSSSWQAVQTTPMKEGFLTRGQERTRHFMWCNHTWSLTFNRIFTIFHAACSSLTSLASRTLSSDPYISCYSAMLLYPGCKKKVFV